MARNEDANMQYANMKRRQRDVVKRIIALFLFLFIDGLVLFLPETTTVHVSAGLIFLLSVGLIVWGLFGLKKLKIDFDGMESDARWTNKTDSN